MTLIVTPPRGAIHTVCSRQRRAALVLFATLAAAFAGPAAASAGQALVNGIRAEDEIVVVNVRSLGSCCDPELLAARVQVELYVALDENGRRQWQASDLESLVDADPSISTVILVHGNRLSAWDAKCEGLAAYRRLARQNISGEPIRYVIFSWPSAQIRGPLKDVRAKAARTRPAGCQLAWLIDQLPEETPLTLVGFSFGARIVTGALHILGGGSLGGMELADLQHPNRTPASAVLITAGLHADWLCPGHYHGLALSQVDRMLLVNNSQDPAMRYYHFSSKGGRPQALGLCGPTCIDPEGSAKITQQNVGRYVGSNHDLFCYLSAPGVMSQIAQYASVEHAGL